MKCLLIIAAVLAVLATVQAKPLSNSEVPQGPQDPIAKPQPSNEEVPANPEIQPVLLNGAQNFNSGNNFGNGNAFIEGNAPAEEDIPLGVPTSA